MAHFDAARRDAPIFRQRVERGCVVHLFRRRIVARALLDHRHEIGIEIKIETRRTERQQFAVAEHGAFAGVGEDDEFVAQVAADRTGVGPHRDGGQAHPVKGVEVGAEHFPVGRAGAFFGQVERVGVLHQELAAAHHAEPGADFVAELPLLVIEVQRQLLVAFHVGPEDVRDQLLVGGAKQHLAVVPVLDAQHFLAIRLIPARLAPEVCLLQRRHQHFDGAGTVHFLAHDLFDPLQDTQAERQPGINAGAILADHAGAQHQLVRDDRGVRRRFLGNGQKVVRQTHSKVSFGLF